MKALGNGSTVIQQISDELKLNVLNPAKEEAEAIVADARGEAQKIMAQARAEAEQLLKGARDQIAAAQNGLQMGLKAACQQAVEALRQAVEKELLNPALHEMVSKGMGEPEVIGKLITAALGAIEKEGLSANVALSLPEAVSAEAIFAALTPALNQKLREGKVLKGKFAGGAKLQLEGKKITIDISDEALMDLLAIYRSDFRNLLFNHV